MTPNFPESFWLIRIERINSDWLNSFGLKVRINFDWCRLTPIQSDSFELQVLIDFEWVSDWFGLKTNYGLDQNETDWCGYKICEWLEKFRIGSAEWISIRNFRHGCFLSFRKVSARYLLYLKNEQANKNNWLRQKFLTSSTAIYP